MRSAWLAMVLVACGGSGGETVSEPPAAEIVAPEPEPTAPIVEPQETHEPPPRRFEDGGDAPLSARALGRGRGGHAFEVEQSCPLARVELDLEVVSKPDGIVRLRAPSGALAQLPLHVLTTSHFVRTWDWAHLDALHGDRGSDVRGTWQLDFDLRGAVYAGGTQTPAPYETPEVPYAALRVYCEPQRLPPPADRTIRLLRDLPEVRRRPGASARALLPIEPACEIDELLVEIHDARRHEGGVRWRLVTPAGDVLPLTGWIYARGERKVVARATGAAGLESHGVWELVSPRASSSTRLRRAGHTIRCR